MHMTVRDLMERLAQFEDTDLIATKQHTVGNDRVTLNFVDLGEIEFDKIFKDGIEVPTVIIG